MWFEVHTLLFKHRLGFLSGNCHWKADNLINTNNYLPVIKMFCILIIQFCCIKMNMIAYVPETQKEKA